MPLESKLTEQQLFDQLISSLVHTTWVSLGKLKNPMTDKIERNLQTASINIDMIDMLYKRMTGNLSEVEDKYLSQILSELKMNYLHEKSQPDNENNSQKSESNEEPVNEIDKPKEKTDKKKSKSNKKKSK